MRIVGGLLLCAAAGIWLNNTRLLGPRLEAHDLSFLAHRGVHQTYAGVRLDRDTCTANPIHPLTHSFIENTLPSMEAAFAAGADVVELDVHLTPDGHFAVFHDWTLECRTDGRGQTNKTDLATLQKLDVGFGYSPDGQTFPLRGTGLGMIPTLPEVFDAFPMGKFLINFKSRRVEEGDALARMLNGNPAYRAQTFGVYGGAEPTETALSQVDWLRGFTKASVKSCLKDYALIGWSGRVPASCRDRLLAVPINLAPFLWGWPGHFSKRMADATTTVILVGPYRGGGFTTGIDDLDLLAKVPEGFDGLIWTNRIETITRQTPQLSQ